MTDHEKHMLAHWKKGKQRIRSAAIDALVNLKYRTGYKEPGKCEFKRLNIFNF